MSTTHRPLGQRRRVLLLSLGAAVTLAVAACGSSKSSSGSSNTPASTSGGAGSSAGSSATSGAGSSAGASGDFSADLTKYSAPVTSYPTVPPISGGVKSLAGKTIWYIPIGDAVPILNNFGIGMQQGLAAAGLKYHICDGKFLPTSIAACLQQAQTQGADGVVTGYVDYEAVPTAFDNLVSHHIPVLIAGAAPDGGKTSNPQLAFFDSTPAILLAQRLQVEQVIHDSGGKAKILFIGVTDSPTTKNGAAYAKTFLKSNCPGCTFTEIDYNTADIQKVPSQVSAALISHPDTTYVVDELDAAGQGTLSGIQNANFTNKVKMVGTNGDLDALQRIKSNTVQSADVGVGSTFQGWQYADGILRMLTGSVPSESIGDVRIFTSGQVGGLSLTPAAYATNAWYGDDTFMNGFKSAWGVS